MKTREEQIVEMAKEMRNYGYEHLCEGRVFYYGFCEKLYDAGYRKQDDTVREFVERLKKNEHCCQEGNIVYWVIDVDDITEIAKEYGVEAGE